MAKQLIDLGTSPNRGDGDPLRVAFKKINDNFNDLYDANFTDPTSLGNSLIPLDDGVLDLGSESARWADVYVKDFVYINGNRLEIDAEQNILVNGIPLETNLEGKLTGEFTGSVFSNDSTQLVDGINGILTADLVKETSLLISAPDVTLNADKIGVNASVPLSSIGEMGDVQGLVAFDSNYIYYCTAAYDGVTNIWKRVAFSGDTW